MVSWLAGYSFACQKVVYVVKETDLNSRRTKNTPTSIKIQQKKTKTIGSVASPSSSTSFLSILIEAADVAASAFIVAATASFCCYCLFVQFEAIQGKAE